MRSLMVCAALLASGVVFADNVLHTATVKNVQQLADGRFALQFDSDSAACANTSSPKSYYLGAGFNGMTAEAAKNAYALAMTAFSMGKRLQISFDEATNGCYINSLTLLGD